MRSSTPAQSAASPGRSRMERQGLGWLPRRGTLEPPGTLVGPSAVPASTTSTWRAQHPGESTWARPTSRHLRCPKRLSA